MVGLGSMAGSVIMGQIVDRLHPKAGSAFVVCSILLASGLSYLQIWQNQYNYISFIMAFIWGISDGFVNTHSLQMCGYEFDTNTDPFSALFTLKALGVFVGLMS